MSATPSSKIYPAVVSVLKRSPATALRTVARHFVSFLYQVDPQYLATTREDLFYAAFREAEQGVPEVLNAQVVHWNRDEGDGIVAPALEVCSLEFADTAGEAPAMAFFVPLVAGREIPLQASLATAEFPVSIQSLMAEVPAVLEAHFKTAGLPIKLLQVEYAKEYTSRESGVYAHG